MSFGHLNHGKSPLEVEQVTGRFSDIVGFVAGGAITAGEVMKLDVSATGEAAARTVVQSDASALAIGVAVEDASSGEPVRVCIAGYIEQVAAVAATAQGAPVYAAANGEVDDLAAASVLPAFGVALTAEAGNGYVSMYIYRKL